jgi:cysteine desulfurase
VRVRPAIPGDDRERHRRAGMENIPAIAGMAAALEARRDETAPEAERLAALATRLRNELPRRVGDLVLHGHETDRLHGLVSFSVLYVEGETMLLLLDQRGIAVHSGSSCTSSTQEPSHVLAAMGAMTHGSLRVSLGRETTAEDVEYFLDEFPPVVEQVRAMTRQEAGSA